MPQENQGITDTDLRTAARILEREGIPMPQRYFNYAAATDLWSLFRIQPNGTRTLLATRDADGIWDDIGD